MSNPDGNNDLPLQIANLLKKGAGNQNQNPKQSLSDNLKISLNLNSQNYALWSRMIRVAIGGKSKALLNHLTANPPEPTDERYDSWEQDDLIVLSWLIHNIEPAIASNLTEFPTAKSLWEALVVTYSNGKDPNSTKGVGLSAKGNRRSDRANGESTIKIDNTKLKCNHCGKSRHTRDQCFHIVGFPDWWSDGSKKTTDEEQSTDGSSVTTSRGGSQKKTNRSGGSGGKGIGGIAAAAAATKEEDGAGSAFLGGNDGIVFVSIDCGETEIKPADSNFIVWTPDDTLVSNGVARVVQTSHSISPVMDTLRVFTSRKKNCYSASVTQGEKVLVRASFNYGNYDRLSNPPTFDLHFNGNFWTTVQTTLSGLIVHEATYVAKRDTVSVCVARTMPNQFPFMSALEIRSVDSNAYIDVDESRALFLIVRFAFGASQILRYPNDAYDRIWIPATAGTESVATEAILVDSTGPNNPPMGIIQNAATVGSKSDALFLGTAPPYIIMYFSEVNNLDSTQTRSFRIYETSTTGSTGPVQLPISPPYGTVVVRDISNYTVNSVTNISLVATVDSDLPPIINAMEAFNISGVLTDGTDNNDVAALALLQSTFDVLGGWSGDPCLPAPYSWDWLNCSNDATPRITALYLDGFELSGSLPDFSSMDALEIIDLHNNILTGTIPDFLGSMHNLQQLNLADNQFSGSIPTSLSKNNKLKLTTTGNPSLCASGKSCSNSPGTINSSPGSTSSITQKKKSSKLPVVLGTTIPAFFLVWIVAGVFIILRRRSTLTNTNTPIVKGGGANGHSGGGANGTLHNVGEEMIHEFVDNVVQQTFGSPSPLLDNSGQTSDLYGQT